MQPPGAMQSRRDVLRRTQRGPVCFFRTPCHAHPRAAPHDATHCPSTGGVAPLCARAVTPSPLLRARPFATSRKQRARAPSARRSALTAAVVSGLGDGLLSLARHSLPLVLLLRAGRYVVWSTGLEKEDFVDVLSRWRHPTHAHAHTPPQHARTRRRTHTHTPPPQARTRRSTAYAHTPPPPPECPATARRRRNSRLPASPAAHARRRP
eukprot:941239-Prymnesium_polylepis.1